MFKSKIYTVYILLTLKLNWSFVEPKPESYLQQRWKENPRYNDDWKMMDRIEKEHLGSKQDLKHLIESGFGMLSSIAEAQQKITLHLEVAQENDKVQQKAMQDIKTTLSKVESQQAHIGNSLKSGWNSLTKILEQARSAQMPTQQSKMSFLPTVVQSFWDNILQPYQVNKNGKFN